MLGRVEHIHTTTASKTKATKNAKTHSDAKLPAQTPGFHLHTAGPLEERGGEANVKHKQRPLSTEILDKDKY